MSEKVLVNQINNAIRAHGEWRIKLGMAVSDMQVTHDIDEVRCDNKCEFGKWLHSTEISAPIRNAAPYRVIKRLHAEFHQCAADVLVYVTANNTGKASELLHGDYTDMSEKLMRGLNKWKDEAIAG